MPISGLIQGGSAMVGQNIGANKLERAESIGKAAGKIGLLSMLVIAALGFVFMPQIMHIFSENAVVIDLGTKAMRAAIFCMPILAYGYGIATLFGGSGYTMPFL